jgi:hypothetical protein
MDKIAHNEVSRRKMLKQFAVGSSAGLLGMFGINSNVFGRDAGGENTINNNAGGVKPIKSKKC